MIDERDRIDDYIEKLENEITGLEHELRRWQENATEFNECWHGAMKHARKVEAENQRLRSALETILRKSEERLTCQIANAALKED